MKPRDVKVIHVRGSTLQTMELGLKYAGVLYLYNNFAMDAGLSFELSYLPPEDAPEREAEHYEQTARKVLQVAIKNLGVRIR